MKKKKKKNSPFFAADPMSSIPTCSVCCLIASLSRLMPIRDWASHSFHFLLAISAR